MLKLFLVNEDIRLQTVVASVAAAAAATAVQILKRKLQKGVIIPHALSRPGRSMTEEEEAFAIKRLLLHSPCNVFTVGVFSFSSSFYYYSHRKRQRGRNWSASTSINTRVRPPFRYTDRDRDMQRRIGGWVVVYNGQIDAGGRAGGSEWATSGYCACHQLTTSSSWSFFLFLFSFYYCGGWRWSFVRRMTMKRGIASRLVHQEVPIRAPMNRKRKRRKRLGQSSLPRYFFLCVSLSFGKFAKTPSVHCLCALGRENEGWRNAPPPDWHGRCATRRRRRRRTAVPAAALGSFKVVDWNRWRRSCHLCCCFFYFFFLLWEWRPHKDVNDGPFVNCLAPCYQNLLSELMVERWRCTRRPFGVGGGRVVGVWGARETLQFFIYRTSTWTWRETRPTPALPCPVLRLE